MPAWLGPIAVVAAQAAEPAPCSFALCRAQALAPFFAALREAGAGGAAVHIIQIGDSHTAGDMITDGWRRRLQARHGNGGRGVLAAGRPYAGYLTWDVTATQSRGWRARASFGGAYSAEGPPLGLSGFTQTAEAVGETLGVTADAPDRAFDRLLVCALTRPGAGTIRLRIGDTEGRWPLAAPLEAPECRTLDSDAAAESASVTIVEAGAVSITSMATLRRGGGAVLSNLGVSGSQLSHFGRTSDAVAAVELAAFHPDLIVLAFGTNEGFSLVLSPDAYEATLRAQIVRLRRLAGRDVPILLLGAPDAVTRHAGLAGQGNGCGGGWFVPWRLEAVRERQIRVARDLDLAFWNGSAAMGGRCSSLAWRRDGMMRDDHVHFTPTGGDRIGAMIDADLAHAFESVR